MSLSQALSTAMSGLRARRPRSRWFRRTSPTRRRPATSARRSIRSPAITGDFGISVRINGVNRELDQYLQTQIRTETSGATYADVAVDLLANLQNVYGNPGSKAAPRECVQQADDGGAGPVDQPGLGSRRVSASSMRRQALAQQLNSTTQGIQNLRANAENGINDSVNTANNAMAQIAAINNQMQNNGADRRFDGLAARSARSVHHSAVQLIDIGGHQRISIR